MQVAEKTSAGAALAEEEPHIDGPTSETDAFAPEPGGNEKSKAPQETTQYLKSYPNEDYNASIVQILAHRDRYHGKKVQIEGYLHVRFEGTAIYLSKEDADYGMTRNGFSVDLSEDAAKYDRTYVLIEGTFDRDRLGHMSGWQGTITNVTRMYELTKSD